MLCLNQNQITTEGHFREHHIAFVKWFNESSILIGYISKDQINAYNILCHVPWYDLMIIIIVFKNKLKGNFLETLAFIESFIVYFWNTEYFRFDVEVLR